MMEKTAQFNVESVDSLVERFRANGLETRSEERRVGKEC